MWHSIPTLLCDIPSVLLLGRRACRGKHFGVNLNQETTCLLIKQISGEISSLRWHISSGKCCAVKAVVTRMLESWETIKSRRNVVPNVEGGVQLRKAEKASGTDPNNISSSTHMRNSSTFPDDSNRASRFTKSGHIPAVLELNLSMKVVTVQLHVDGQSGSDLQHMTLVARMQDTSLR